MKPARSPHVTACLPTFAHRSCTVATTSGAVETVWTTSTSFITCAGLKKCIPTTSCGREVTLAQSMIGTEHGVGRGLVHPALLHRAGAAATECGDDAGDRLLGPRDEGDRVPRLGEALDDPRRHR